MLQLSDPQSAVRAQPALPPSRSALGSHQEQLQRWLLRSTHSHTPAHKCLSCNNFFTFQSRQTGSKYKTAAHKKQTHAHRDVAYTFPAWGNILCRFNRNRRALLYYEDKLTETRCQCRVTSSHSLIHPDTFWNEHMAARGTKEVRQKHD